MGWLQKWYKRGLKGVKIWVILGFGVGQKPVKYLKKGGFMVIIPVNSGFLVILWSTFRHRIKKTAHFLIFVTKVTFWSGT